MKFPSISLALPSWIEEWLADQDQAYPTPEARMQFVIELSRQNVQRQTGGPFAAAIFDMETQRLVAPAVNQVLASHCSIAHAEMLAIAIAQRLVGSHDLRLEGHAGHELVSSTEPCAVCLGSIPWAGIRRLMYAACDEDARQVGFDEGQKPADWQGGLVERGIEVVPEVCREEAAEVIRAYAAAGGAIY